jgi:AcrR family transcriptional regulator
MAAVAVDAGVSIKTIEARFRTKAALLGSVVDFAIRGDASSVPIIERETVAAMKGASDAGSFLKLHARLVRGVHERSAGVQAAVENAAATEAAAQDLWQQMLRNRRNGTTGPAQRLLTLPGLRDGITIRDAATVFWLTTDWSYWRALHHQLGFSADAVEAWTHNHYKAAFLDAEANHD